MGSNSSTPTTTTTTTAPPPPETASPLLQKSIPQEEEIKSEDVVAIAKPQTAKFSTLAAVTDYIAACPFQLNVASISQTGYGPYAPTSAPFVDEMVGGIITYGTGDWAQITRVVNSMKCFTTRPLTTGTTTATISWGGIAADVSGNITAVGHSSNVPVLASTTYSAGPGLWTTWTPTLPSYQVGNLIVLVVVKGYNTATISVNSGYTGVSQNNSMNIVSVFYKIAGASEPNPTITASTSTTGCANFMIYGNVDQVGPIFWSGGYNNMTMTGNPPVQTTPTQYSCPNGMCLWIEAVTNFSGTTTDDVTYTSAIPFTSINSFGISQGTVRTFAYQANWQASDIPVATLTATGSAGYHTACFSGIYLCINPAMPPTKLLNYGRLINKGAIQGSTVDADNSALSVGTDPTLSSSVILGNASTPFTVNASSVIRPNNPCFSAFNSSGASNVTGDNTYYTVQYPSVAFQQGTGYNSSTGIFTAPCDGLYLFDTTVYFYGMSSANTVGVVQFNLNGSGSNMPTKIDNPWVCRTGNGDYSVSLSGRFRLVANDQVYVALNVRGSSPGTKNVSLGSFGWNTFSGNLL